MSFLHTSPAATRRVRFFGLRPQNDKREHGDIFNPHKKKRPIANAIGLFGFINF